jgi:protein-tyrosine phosphatase
MKPDLYWIPGPWRGSLAVANRPRGGDWLGDEAAGWRRAGVDVVVSLLERDEAAQLELAQEEEVAGLNGIDFVSFPIPDRGVPASLPPVRSLLKRIAEALEDGRNVAVHCRQGIGRSGMIAAAVLVSSGTETEKAIEAVSSARGVPVPETPAQLEWLQLLSSERPVGTYSK